MCNVEDAKRPFCIARRPENACRFDETFDEMSFLLMKPFVLCTAGVHSRDTIKYTVWNNHAVTKKRKIITMFLNAIRAMIAFVIKLLSLLFYASNRSFDIASKFRFVSFFFLDCFAENSRASYIAVASILVTCFAYTENETSNDSSRNKP